MLGQEANNTHFNVLSQMVTIEVMPNPIVDQLELPNTEVLGCYEVDHNVQITAKINYNILGTHVWLYIVLSWVL